MFAFVAALFFATLNSAHGAFEFTPIIATLAPSGEKATASFNVTNLNNTKIPVQVYIVPREPDINGKEKYTQSPEVDKLFQIYPAGGQLVVEPKKTRSVRVTWVGSPKPQSELPFRIIAEELPIDLDDPNKVYKKAVAKVDIAIRYVGSLYVSPAGTKPKLNLEATPSKEKPGQMVLNIANQGTAHQVIKRPKLKLRSTVSNKELEISGDELKDLHNQNILPGRSRQFVLNWPKSLPAGPVKVSIDLAQE